jgi:hypothetical protein
MKTRRSARVATGLGRRGIVLFVAGALAMGLGVTAVHAGLAGGASSMATPTFTLIPARPVVSSIDARPALKLIPARPSPTPSPTPTWHPWALNDGVYPTYIRGVDVDRATITIDIVQTFVGEAAHQAAVQDGLRWGEMQYDPVYIRNENPALLTLPVARDVRIKLIHICMAPNRRVGLMELRDATRPFTKIFYYEVLVVEGKVELVQQFVAVAAC